MNDEIGIFVCLDKINSQFQIDILIVLLWDHQLTGKKYWLALK